MKKYSTITILTLVAVLFTNVLFAQLKDANTFANMIQGDWEMKSRISNGKEANTEGMIYINLSKNDNGFIGEQLATESGILDAFVSGGGDNLPYEIASLFNLTITQSDNNTIKFISKGEIMGSFGVFKKGVPSEQHYTFIKKGKSFILQSQIFPVSGSKQQQQETEIYDKIILTNDKIIFSSSSMKLTDTYKRISVKGGKVGGLWNLKKFYELFKEKITLNK